MNLLADWRKSKFYQPSSASSRSSGDVIGEARNGSETSNKTSMEYESNNSEGGHTSSDDAMTPLRNTERGSMDYGNIERARRNSSSYLQDEHRDSMDSSVSSSEMIDDIVTMMIPVEGEAMAMYSEPRSLKHVGMFDIVHASMWLWQEKSKSVMWANKSACEAHNVSVTKRVSISEEYSRPYRTRSRLNKFVSQKLAEVESGSCLLYLKGQAKHILPCILSTRRKEEYADIVEVVIKPFVLKDMQKRTPNGKEQCCLVEIVNSLTKESARDVEMFMANTGNTFLVDLSGRLLCRKQSGPMFSKIEHMHDLLSGTLQEKNALMDDIQCRIFQSKESSVYLTEQSEKNRTWASIEVRKSRDPVTYKSALFLSVSDVTDMKNAEQALISNFHTIKEENDRFWDDQRQCLQNDNHEVPKSETETVTRKTRHSVQLAPSPAEMVSELLDELIDGNKVSRNRLMFVQQAFSGGTDDCYEPMNLRNELSMDLNNESNRVLWELLGDGPGLNLEDDKSGREWRRESLDIKNSDSVSEYKWYLHNVDRWDFDVFKFAEHSKGRPLTILAMYLMEKEGLISQFGMDKNVLRRYIQRIEVGYPDNPYHNRIHACGVLHMTYMIISKGGMNKSEFQPQAILSCFLAAITHDFDHPGKTSDFLIRTEDKLAITYNDSSPLENYHISAAWSLLLQSKYNFLANVNDGVKKSIREMWIDLVMATDMKKHLGIVAQFKSRTSSRHTNTGSGTSGIQTNCATQEIESTHRTTLQMLVKIADLGHLAAPLAMHKKWVALLEEEFFRQGDTERTNNIPVSAFMDREQKGISATQCTFFEIVALPTFEAFAHVFQNTGVLHQRVKANYENWIQVNDL
jgi:hypothetical protein